MNIGSLRAVLLTLSIASLLAGSASAAPEKAGLTDQFDKILRFPGDYSQNCDFALSSFPAPLPAFHSIMHGDAGISEANMDFLRQNRANLLPIIAAKLDSADLLRKPLPQPRDPAISKEQQDLEPRGVDPASFSTLLLTIIEELNAVEVLPRLLAIEEKYHPLLQAFEKDAKAPMPSIDGSQSARVLPHNLQTRNLLKQGEDYDKLSKERIAEMDRLREVFDVQAVHRDILAVCVHIMRKAGYEPLLSSNLEKLYGELLKKEYGADKVLSKYKDADDIPESERYAIKFDPVHKLAHRVNADLGIPYSPELREEILDLTKSFIASRNPPKKKEP